MRILFIGDSLVKGSVGMNWVKRIATKNPDWEIDNAGVNGETLIKISQRLDKKLATNQYDVIFLQAGTNDLLIPVMNDKGFFFRQAQKYLTAKGYQPQTTPADFEKEFRQCISDIKNKTTATIIVSTLSCISECLESPINQKRCLYNHIIRDIAKETGCNLVDAGACFDGYLRRCRTKDYLLESFFNTVYSDKFQCRVLACPDYLSKKRRLHLTIDGVHLNSRGANIYRDETEKQVRAIISYKKAGVLARLANFETY
jgi:lysophospholipase L1-like esterase